MPLTLLPIAVLLGAFLGALVGVLLAARRQRPAEFTESSPDPIDEYTAAAIDQAAVNFATANGRPEAAPLIADKLRLLHTLGRRRER